MQLRSLFTAFALAGTILTAGGCVTHSDLERYATVSQLDTLRGELKAELQRVEESSTKAEQSAPRPRIRHKPLQLRHRPLPHALRRLPRRRITFTRSR